MSIIGAALSIPSSLALIVRFFAEPHEQSIAIALFGGFAALANGKCLFSRWRYIIYLLRLRNSFRNDN